MTHFTALSFVFPSIMALQGHPVENLFLLFPTRCCTAAPPACHFRELHEWIHGSDQRSLWSQRGGFPARRSQPPQHDDPARPRCWLLWEEQHCRTQTWKGGWGNHGKKNKKNKTTYKCIHVTISCYSQQKMTPQWIKCFMVLSYFRLSCLSHPSAWLWQSGA